MRYYKHSIVGTQLKIYPLGRRVSYLKGRDMRNILLDRYLSSYDVTAIRETQKNNNVKPDFDSDIDVDIYPSRDNPLVVEDPEEESR